MKKLNSNHKGKKKSLVVFILTMILVLIITGCSNGSATTTDALSNSNEVQANTSTANTDEESTAISTDYENSTIIKLGDEIIIEGDQEGITVTDQVVQITKGGFYSISGTLTNGQILLEGNNEIFTIELNDVDITNSSGPAILTLEAEHTYVLLAENTVNTLTDGGKNEEHEAPLFSCDDMTISGEGTLNIFGNYQEGIESNDILTINGGIINIEAPDDALNAGDGIVINDGNIKANSGGDGIDSNGDLTINGGSIKVSAGNNANGPVDTGDGASYKFIVNGGTVIASGGNMSISTDTSSTQNVIWIYDVFTDNEEITLTDEAGNVLFTTTLQKAASALFISADFIEVGQTYNLVRANQETQSFTVSELSTTIGETKGMGGNMGGHIGERPSRNTTGGPMAPPEGGTPKMPAEGVDDNQNE